jgi:hypothetical protein
MRVRPLDGAATLAEELSLQREEFRRLREQIAAAAESGQAVAQLKEALAVQERQSGERQERIAYLRKALADRDAIARTRQEGIT